MWDVLLLESGPISLIEACWAHMEIPYDSCIRPAVSATLTGSQHEAGVGCFAFLAAALYRYPEIYPPQTDFLTMHISTSARVGESPPLDLALMACASTVWSSIHSTTSKVCGLRNVFGLTNATHQ
jgi:hypothetical protein